MAHVQHMNLTWDVPSPSYWRLDPRYSGPDVLDISFEDPGWRLYLARADGSVATGWFPTRDDAICLVYQACRNEGIV